MRLARTSFPTTRSNSVRSMPSMVLRRVSMSCCMTLPAMSPLLI